MQTWGNLAGYLKVKLKGNGLRAVYRLERTEETMLVAVVSIRDDNTVYKEAARRIRKHRRMTVKSCGQGIQNCGSCQYNTLIFLERDAGFLCSSIPLVSLIRSKALPSQSHRNRR